MDEALIELFGKSCAVQIYNNETASIGGKFGLDCISEASEGSGESPFGPKAYVVSIGYAVVLVVALPLGYWNLDDNIWVQNFAFCGLCFIVCEWCIQALVHGIDFDKNDVPVAGSDQSQIGTVLFNYAFVTTVPSWVNEKKVGVPINKSIWGSSFLGTMMFLFTGLLCAGAWDSSSGNLLSLLTKSSTPGVGNLTRALAYLFPIIALVTSIPIFSIIVRYNLLENNLCGPFWASFWGAVFPWLAAIALYTGDALDDVVNWSGLLTIVPLNFALPAWFYIQSLTVPAQSSEYLDDDEAAEAGLETALISHQHHPWTPELAAQEATGTWSPGDLVRVWIPGHQWVPATVTSDQNDDNTYSVTCEGLQENDRDIAVSNIKSQTDLLFGQQQTDIQEETDSNPVEQKPIEHMSPRRLVEKRHLNELQIRLDRYEQEIERLREEINAFIIQYPGEGEQVTLKKLHQKEMKKLQRHVDIIIQDMEDTRTGNIKLSPAQRDELFAALPSKMSTRTKVVLAWVLIVVTTVFNIVALAYAINSAAS
eukprot:TRINITY_DN3113_c2_g1_i3.p1 TRINITY_DN3113_c2_g1~~TRINITY_DN3113_c2_g1_i3.p1  ORF type:complete len:537 (+),score=101.58 TRINITY_DN3113_c2_g1_i3:577-2187(+)